MKTIRLFRKRFMVVAILVCVMTLLGLTIVQARNSSISLDSPVSFPVDI